MFLIWIRTASGGFAPQKWRMRPTDLTSGHFKQLITKTIGPLPEEDHGLSLKELAAKYPCEAVKVAPVERIELPTRRFGGCRSTNELNR